MISLLFSHDYKSVRFGKDQEESTLILLSWLWLVPMGVLMGHVTMRLACKSYFAAVGPTAWNVLVNLMAAIVIFEWLFSTSTVVIEQETIIILTIKIAIRVVGACIGLYIGESILPVALTGSIATGKSTVANLFQQENFEMVDLDKIAHDILLPTSKDSVYNDVLKEFGTGILMEQKDNSSASLQQGTTIDRRKLGAIVFADHSKRRKLNRITHPRIRTVMMREMVMKSFSKNQVCVDVPLLYESGWMLRVLFGLEVVVACMPELQYQRLRQRNPDLSPAQCRERMASQLPIEKKAEAADVVIWNNGSLQELELRVDQVRREIKQRTRAGLSRLVAIMALGLYMYLWYVVTLQE